MTAKLK